MKRLLIIAIAIFTALAPRAYAGWKTLSPGMEFGVLTAGMPKSGGNIKITILRIDPKLWEMVLVGKSWNDTYENKPARAWCEDLKLTAAINAGMFATDYVTHVGYMAADGHVNNSHVNKYMSVAAFHPRKGKKVPEFRIYDLDAPTVSMKKIRANYGSVVQNLRLIKRPGENRWPQQKKMWSETALGEDRSGRVLFIFVRSPVTMHDFNKALLALDIGVVAAQHLEGGPEAQLYVRAGDLTRELFGSYETAFREDDSNASQWPIPNIIGVRPIR